MSSAQGRFTSPAPTFLNILKVVNPQRWNLYGYALNNPLKYVDPDGEEAIAILYPGYQVGIHGNFSLPLGHAGVVMVDQDGSTHYFEYGRYPHDDNVPGVVRNAGASDTPTPAVERDASGKITAGSMEKLLSTLSGASGHGGAVDALVFDTATIEDAVMLAYLRERQRQNSDANRQSYSIRSHNCGTLMCEAFDRAGHPAPNSFVRWGATPWALFDQLQADSGPSQKVSYDPKKKEKVTSTICYGNGVCEQQ